MKNYFWLFWFLLFNGLDTWATEHVASNFSDCGKVEEIPEDVRSRAPWTAAIYVRNQDSNSPSFFTTGTIIGPTSVLTLATGAFGTGFMGKNQTTLPPPGSFFVVAGINATMYRDGDPHLQKSEVIFLEPDIGYDANRENDYHLVIFHLKTILKFHTPYVKALCVLPLSLGYYNEISLVGYHLNSSGFTVTSFTESKRALLRREEILTLSTEHCTSAFSFQYKREIDEHQIYCGVKSKSYDAETYSSSVRVVDPEWDSTNFRKGPVTERGELEAEESCYLSGAVNTVNIDGKLYLAGLLALIPEKQRWICSDRNLYFYARTSKNLAWLHQSIQCSPNKFSCGDPANTCIRLFDVCNGMSDCPGNDRDENQLFCAVSNQCKGNSSHSEMHSCGLNGDCIQKSQVCDGTLDCLDGNDEDPDKCRRESASPANRTKGKSCLKFKIPARVVTSCRNNHNETLGEPCIEVNKPGTELNISCAPLYMSNHEYSSLNLICDGATGEWRNRRPFSCVAECGIFQNVTQQGQTGAVVDQNLPWNGLLTSRVGVPNCSAVLIDPSFILTTASCVESQTPDALLAVIEPTSLDLMFNSPQSQSYAQFVNVKQFWIPKWFTGQSVDLALAKINTVATDEMGQGTPVCYLNSASIYKMFSRVNATGKVVHMKESLDKHLDQKVEILTSDFALSPRSDCIKYFGLQNVPSYLFCGRVLGESLGPLDIGAGLYISEQSPSSENLQMHLKGILLAPKVKLRSSSSREKWVQLFVNTDYFINWATEIISKNYLSD